MPTSAFLLTVYLVVTGQCMWTTLSSHPTMDACMEAGVREEMSLRTVSDKIPSMVVCREEKTLPLYPGR